MRPDKEFIGGIIVLTVVASACFAGGYIGGQKSSPPVTVMVDGTSRRINTDMELIGQRMDDGFKRMDAGFDHLEKGLNRMRKTGEGEPK